MATVLQFLARVAEPLAKPVIAVGFIVACWVNVTMPVRVGADRALMASPPSQSALSRPIGFDPGEGVR